MSSVQLTRTNDVTPYPENIETLPVQPHKAVTKACNTTTGEVTFTLCDSQNGLMRLPKKLNSSHWVRKAPV